MAAVLLADAVAYHKAHGRTPHDALQAIWAKCGCFQEDLHNITLPGQEEQARGFVMVRPSGTEPKLKLYFSVTGRDESEARDRLKAVKHETLSHMGLA
jgi:phosphomannomutase